MFTTIIKFALLLMIIGIFLPQVVTAGQTFTTVSKRSGSVDMFLYSDGKIGVKQSYEYSYKVLCNRNANFETASTLANLIGVATADTCSWTTSYSTLGFKYTDVNCEWSDATFDQCATNANTAAWSKSSGALKLSKCWRHSLGLSSGSSWYIRLSKDGNSRLEVRPLSSSTWGTVAYSSDSATFATASQLCKFFGFSSANPKVTSLARSSSSTVPVHVSGLVCSLSHSTFADCPKSTSSDSDFSKGTADLALSCGPMTAADARSSLTYNSDNPDAGNGGDDESGGVPLFYIIPGVWVGIIIIWLIVKKYNGEIVDEDEIVNTNANLSVLANNNNNNNNNNTNGVIATGAIVNEDEAEKRRREDYFSGGIDNNNNYNYNNNNNPNSSYPPAPPPPPQPPVMHNNNNTNQAPTGYYANNHEANLATAGAGDNVPPPVNSYNFGAFPNPPPPSNEAGSAGGYGNFGFFGATFPQASPAYPPPPSMNNNNNNNSYGNNADNIQSV